MEPGSYRLNQDLSVLRKSMVDSWLTHGTTKPGIVTGFFVAISNHLLPTFGRFFYCTQEKKMLAPVNPSRPLSRGSSGPTLDFETFLSKALHHASSIQEALRFGVCPASLCRYAAGKMSDEEQQETHAILVHQPWALNRVSTLVRAARRGTLAASILAASSRKDVSCKSILQKVQNQISSTIHWKDPELSLAVVLDSLE